MIRKYKIDSTAIKPLLAKLNTLTQGQSFELPPLLPALSDAPVTATIVEKEDNFWTLVCMWNGVNIGDLQVEIDSGQILLEDV